jgi:hypothetical protein
LNRARNRTLVILSALFLLVSFYSHPGWLPFAPSVHAQPAPARVYIESPNGSSNFTDLGKTRSSITFSVKIASAPSIGGFLVFIIYNSTGNKSILTSPSIDYSGNVLGATTSVVNNCVANLGICSGLDYNGVALNGLDVLSLGLAIQCDCPTPAVTNGLLFNVTFHVNSAISGIGQIHLLEAQYSAAGTGDHVDAATYDGYYVNTSCPSSSQTPCQPPTVAYQITPAMPSQGSVASFNLTVTDNNRGASITYVRWDWGDTTLAQNQTDLSQLMQHIFALTSFGASNCVFQGKCLVGLTVHDTNGIVWQSTVVVTILHIFVDISVGPTALTLQSGNPISQIFPGTSVYVTAVIRNFGTVAETATMSIASESKVLNSSLFSLGPQGLHNASSSISAVWDTSGLTPRVYSIFVTISNLVTPGCSSIGICLKGNVNQTYIAQTDPTSTLSKTLYVLIVTPEALGTFSLSLLQSTALGVIVLLGVGAGLARFMRKPSYETEPL